jgi:uncharacterized protein YlzI (FlbEa/FlbD family)
MKPPCDILRDFLKEEHELLNMATIESLAALPKTKLSHIITGKRDFAKQEINQVLEVFERFIKRFEKLKQDLKKIEKP